MSKKEKKIEVHIIDWSKMIRFNDFSISSSFTKEQREALAKEHGKLVNEMLLGTDRLDNQPIESIDRIATPLPLYKRFYHKLISKIKRKKPQKPRFELITTISGDPSGLKDFDGDLEKLTFNRSKFKELGENEDTKKDT